MPFRLFGSSKLQQKETTDLPVNRHGELIFGDILISKRISDKFCYGRLSRNPGELTQLGSLLAQRKYEKAADVVKKTTGYERHRNSEIYHRSSDKKRLEPEKTRKLLTENGPWGADERGIDLQRDTAYARPAARFAATVTITVTTTATTTTTMKKVVAVPVITEKKVVAIIITITTMNRIVAVTIITTVKGIMAVTIAMQASPVDMGPLTVVNPLAIMEVTTVVNPLAIMEVPTEMIDVMSVPAVSTDTIIADNAHIAETVDFAEEKPCVIVDTSEAQDVD